MKFLGRYLKLNQILNGSENIVVGESTLFFSRIIEIQIHHISSFFIISSCDCLAFISNGQLKNIIVNLYKKKVSYQLCRMFSMFISSF